MKYLRHTIVDPQVWRETRNVIREFNEYQKTWDVQNKIIDLVKPRNQYTYWENGKPVTKQL